MKGILKYVGGEYWTWPQDHISEVKQRGPSIRIAPDSIPDIPTPYSVLFVHPRGTFTVSEFGLQDLLAEIVNECYVPTMDDEDDYIQEGLPTLKFIGLLKYIDSDSPSEFKRLVRKYGIEFRPAVTHYSYITGNQVVIGDNGEGEELYETLQSRGVDVEAVKVVRIEKGEEEYATDEF